MLRRRLVVPAVLALLASVALSIQSPVTTTAPRATQQRAPLLHARPAAVHKPPIVFSSPRIADAVHTYGEPDIKIARTGAVYVSGPWGTGTQRSIWNQSLDGGHSFFPLHDHKMTSAQESDTNITGPGGGDTELSISRSGKVFYSDLAALVQLKVATWNPRTHQMPISVIHSGASALNGYDRQWFALWDPPNPKAAREATGYTGPFPVNYLVHTEATLGADCGPNSLFANCHGVRYSKDGVNYSETTAHFLDANDGSMAIDQRTGTVFMATSIDNPRNVAVAIMKRPHGQNANPALTKVQLVKVADLPQGTVTGATLPFPTVAIDRARNLYAVWVTVSASDKTVAQQPAAWQVYYSYARASTGWTKWSTPVQINRGTANTNLFVWSTAGTKGRLGVAWYGTPDSTHNPSTQDVHQKWHVYVARIFAADSADPQIVQVRATPRPMHYGTICLAGLGCAAEDPPGNRNLADFFEIEVDPRDGSMWVVYDDTGNELKQEPAAGAKAPEQADHTGAPVVTVIHQIRGLGLFGKEIGQREPVRRSLGDRLGDAIFDPVYGGVHVPQLDLRDTAVRREGNQLVVRMRLTNLQNPAAALEATGAGAVDWVARWNFGPRPGPTGQRWPIYYAAVEVDPSGGPHFFAGLAKSVELCSVSGCFPHILEYPRPPYGGTNVTGKKVVFTDKQGVKHYLWVIRVPLSVIGNPDVGAKLQSFGAWTFARNRPANSPITNNEGEAGLTPVAIDGACCKTQVVRAQT